ncbi:hypothetical protein BW723_14845 [Polaribacter reichenbachii]|uniref:Methyltransferase n=1 Tax=Polaribacter reichenbachii TaxID=996801 RepID=A0A1B8U4F9_9FLAO|nr:class I SAM-dependent methyltransferase [Polaribacter reichenbachii]APZ47483.1 hypothetical protein BW723_14845 [Polaribacter reichenbachii]AUC18122.1 hypothetical protein BTO17_05285 [Polaribacter reichenbachii]OBY66733.1 hypothetical protein LPB301_05915 [Polaribacter reichenbachii]
MKIIEQQNIENILEQLFKDAKNDYFKMITGITKGIIRPFKPADFKNAYLSISKLQGEELKEIIINNDIKNVVEFGTSFGISTLFLAQGVLETNGNIITTELIESKAKRAIENFKNAGVYDLIDVRIGDALETLRNFNGNIDLLFLDGWKDLYLPLFQMLAYNFNSNTIIYVDNADMSEPKDFLKTIAKTGKYDFESKHDGKAVLITLKK